MTCNSHSQPSLGGDAGQGIRQVEIAGMGEHNCEK